MSAPILCADLLRKVDAKLLELLGSLRPDEWDLPTVAPAWTVRDVAAHLLDTPLRKLSLARDGWFVEKASIQSPADVAALVNRLNREGVAVYRRLSPPVLLAWMAWACRESAEFHESLDPFAPAAFPVSWAGQQTSPNWFDTARELTERWHHQQQIREATNRPGIMTRELYYPVLDCFARGLPYAYRNVEAAAGALVQVEVVGACGGAWLLRRDPAGWTLEPSGLGAADARIAIPEEIAWRVFTKGISRAAALEKVSWEGDRLLALRALELTAIVA